MLTPSELMTLLGMVATAIAAFVGVREQTKGLKAGQDEMLRQMGAFHKRLDHYGAEVNRIDKNHARLEERIYALKESQRFRLQRKLALSEAEMAGEAPMFVDGGEGGDE